ncbi:SAC3/GANP/THP [Trema orientale]|uniref:SAC3/GANP/THP n=1 Tax=Trema orientale TaxID=63057 RepID=A0A2P5F152_TREOI|nr:SAC3/GANP/THP [Trema orientale]
MNQGVNTETIAALDSNSLENRYAYASQGQISSHLPSITGSEALSWTAHKVDNNSAPNGIPSNSTYHYDQHMQQAVTSSASLGTVNAPQDYNGYASYTNPTDPYGYGSTGYSGYYNGYQQQSNPSYSQPVGAYQNTGAPYQPLSSFQNTGSYAGSASYSSTYYNPGDYQTAGGYPSSSYNNQTTPWNDTNYANYTSQQYAQYNTGTSAAYSSGSATANAAATSLNYQQQYKQWADYYNQTEVTCAPGTENTSVTGASNFGCPVPSVTSGYPTSNSQPAPPPPPPPPSYNPSWRPESSSSELPSVQSGAVVNGAHDGYWRHGPPTSQINHTTIQPHLQKPSDQNSSFNSFQDQQKSLYSQGPNSQYSATNQAPLPPPPPPPVPSYPQGPSFQYPAVHQVPPAPQTYQSPPQNAQSLDTRRVGKLQIPTNPRIASNLNLGLAKTDRDSSTTVAAAKPAYISVSLPKPDDKVTSSAGADSILKPGMFPKSLRGYVERALARCKGDMQMTACQAVMKEMITKATADGTLYTRNWDIEPLFPMPNADVQKQDNVQSSTAVSPLENKLKRSPSRRTKSRWEPLPEERPVEKPPSINHNTSKFTGWVNANERDKKTFMMNTGSKDGSLTFTRFSSVEQKGSNKITQKPVKRQRLIDSYIAADNGDSSSDSDKEQSLTAYYSGAMALANSPEERKRRESRSKRFERRQGNGAEANHLKSKSAVSGSLYSRRATAMVLSKNFEDGGSRAVEDIDWDALTVKGTCQEIEKRYLRLTSAPDPATVRPEEVVEKALLMVQSSQKNYLYKCDQLKSIRQDLTVQRIRNHLTVKVYETHARLALEVGDLPEYNQCQSQLQSLYAEGIEGCHLEFAAYNLLCVILHSNNNRDLVSSMSRLSNEAKRDKAVKHALAVRAAVTSGNYVMFFRLFKTAPNLNTCLMDLYVEKMRFKAVSCMSRSYRPTLPVPYIAQVLGFTSIAPENDGSDDKDSDGLEECIEWLKAHGACLTADNNGEMQLDAKSTSSTLYMPEPDDAVAHGDASLAVNDFLTRTAL